MCYYNKCLCCGLDTKTSEDVPNPEGNEEGEERRDDSSGESGTDFEMIQKEEMVG